MTIGTIYQYFQYYYSSDLLAYSLKMVTMMNKIKAMVAYTDILTAIPIVLVFDCIGKLCSNEAEIILENKNE